MNVVPWGNRVLVRIIESPDRTPGGLYLPDTAKDKSRKGVVIAVGPGARDPDNPSRHLPMELKVGHKVLYNAWAGSEVPEYKDLRIINESDVVALFSDDNG